MSEAYARILIDEALNASGWDLHNPRQVRYEVTGVGRSDYTLLNHKGALCIVEAKDPELDPYDAKDQARGYAENQKAPFIILSNGTEHWFWNHRRTDRDAYRIERFPSPQDLERLLLKEMQPPRPLMSEVIGPDYLRAFNSGITVRNYQIRALDAIGKEYDAQHKRRFLLEMATGTGKTLLCAALIRRFLQTRNAERVLFIVDRIELAKQTMEDFERYLPEYKPVLYKTARRKPGELLGSSVVVATLQSLQVDRRYRTEFTPFFFDLVVNDEAHRSIYGDAREVVQFFQGTRIGLTATPKAYLKNVDLEQLATENPKALEARELRDTYHYFGCEPGIPTFRYDLVDAVNDPEGPFLCLPKIFDLRSDVTTQALEDGGWTVTINEQEENYKLKDLERKVFVPARNRLMCEAFLANAQKQPDGTLGKSIVFAVNQNHATALTKLLNELMPGSAITITSRIPGASDIAKDFRDGKRPERIAVSVDMLSTGYNCRDLLNVVLMRPIFSPTEYIQIKGRGTRLYTFTVGHAEYEKKNFFLIDFCAVAEYFQEKYDYTVPLSVPVPKGEQKGSGAGYTEPEDSVPASQLAADDKPPLPTWEGRDTLVNTAVRVVGREGEKVDVLTFRGNFEQDLKQFAAETPALQEAVNAEDDDAVDSIMNEGFYHKPEMYYSPDKLIVSYGVPASTPAFVYHALGKKPLPSKDDLVGDTVDSIAARFDLRYREQKWLAATAQLIVDDPEALSQFLHGDMGFFRKSQFQQLGGLDALVAFEQRDAVFDALRQSIIVRQNSLLINPQGEA
ncbi:MAG: DEAD/DEAH box helicase family protein [Flavobacteriales bacterium]|nr:DEAD/DEAH box helicase family protein [Flavobacteriales bacterium]